MSARVKEIKSQRHIIICPPLKRVVRKVSRRLKGENFHWAYFEENISRAIATGEELRREGQRIDIAGRLQEVAQSFPPSSY